MPAASAEFPIGDTLAGGSWRVTEHLRGTGSQQLHLATRADRPDARALVSTIWAPRGAPGAELLEKLGYRLPGVLELVHLGPFDPSGDELRRTHQRQHVALVERLPDGRGADAGSEWLPRLVSGPLGPRAAVELGRSVGAILARAADAGPLLVGVRPEYIWATRDGDQLRATGLSGRNWELFAHTGGGCLVPGRLFERHYYAPEVYRERGEGPESLVFTLAAMIAEWATGQYPFPDSWAGGNMQSLCEGRHAPLDLRPPMADLLGLCLDAEPAHRPSLPYLLRRLELLSRSAPADAENTE